MDDAVGSTDHTVGSIQLGLCGKNHGLHRGEHEPRIEEHGLCSGEHRAQPTWQRAWGGGGRSYLAVYSELAALCAWRTGKVLEQALPLFVEVSHKLDLLNAHDSPATQEAQNTGPAFRRWMDAGRQQDGYMASQALRLLRLMIITYRHSTYEFLGTMLLQLPWPTRTLTCSSLIYWSSCVRDIQNAPEKPPHSAVLPLTSETKRQDRFTL